ncbi:MAG: cytochrome P450 [Pirellulaceae bacterium]|nr:cytochrome P450 [Pirellulaceae bacterium]
MFPRKAKLGAPTCSPIPPGPYSISAWFAGTWRHVVQLSFNPLPFLDSLQQYGDLSYFRMFKIRAFAPNHPDLVREVLTTQRHRLRKLPRDTRAVSQLTGRGILVTEGDEWLRQRRMIQPAFQPRHLASFARPIAEETERMLDRWEPGTIVDMADEMADLTMKMAARMILGVRLDERADLVSGARILSEAFISENRTILRLPDWVPLPHQRRKRWAMALYDQFLRETIAERRLNPHEGDDVLSLLLKAVDVEGDGRGMTDEQARDEAMTLFTAAFHANSMALAFTLYLLTQHADVEEKLLEEIDGASRGSVLGPADLSRLPYTQMVVKESLRLYPPAWALFTREVTEEFELGGYRLRPGNWVMVFPYLLHRNERLFADPTRFDPSRFAPDREQQIPQYGYIPYGGGPRVCIGNTMSSMQLPLILANVLRRCRLRLAHPEQRLRIQASLALRPRGGLPMTIEMREPSKLAPPALQRSSAAE